MIVGIWQRQVLECSSQMWRGSLVPWSLEERLWYMPWFCRECIFILVFVQTDRWPKVPSSSHEGQFPATIIASHKSCILWNLTKSQMNMNWSSVLQQIKNIPGCWIKGKICKEESQPIRRGLSSNILVIHISLPAIFKVYLNLGVPFVNHLMLPQKTKHYILFFLTLVCRVVFWLW